MAKRFSRINFILVSILVAIGLFLSFCSFKIPFYVNDYAGFMGAITLSYDIGEGQTGVFQVEPCSEEVTTVTQKEMNDTLTFVRKVLSNFNASFNQVGLQNDNGLRVDIPHSDTSADLISALSNRLEIVIRGEDTADKTELDISASRIKSCRASYQPTSSTSSTYSFGVYIEFDDLGTKQYKELTKSVASNGNTVYFYDTEGNKLGNLAEISREVSSGTTFMAISSLNTEHAANMYAVNVMMGTKDVKLVLKENSETSAFLGYNTIKYVAISLAVAFVCIIAFMIIRYRDLGLISMLSGLINIVLYLFLLQALPIVTLSISGIIGCVIGFALTMLCNVIVFEKIRKEYAKGRKIPLAFKLGFKQSLFDILDVSCIAAIASLVMYFIGFDILKSFAIPLFIGAVLSMLSSLCITRLFTKWYLPLNSTKESHLALKKETSNEE